MNDRYLRKENESDFEYKARLLKYKLEDKEDIDWQEIVNLLGLECSSDHLRKTAYGFIEAYNYMLENNGNNVDDTLEQIKREKDELKQLKKDYQEYSKELKRLESREERRLRVVEKGDYYTIYSGKRELRISKQKVKAIKELYCDEDGLEINAICRKLNIPRRDFMLVKYAFDITHNDVPYLDEELDGDIDELVEETLEKKKNKYFLKLAEKEIDELKEEVKKFRSKDYLYNKIIENIEAIEIQPIAYSVEIRNNIGYREALLDLADLHIGEKVDNYWNRYNTEIARERFNKLTQETIKICNELGVTVLHVSNLGDDVSGIINETLTREAEIPIEEQVSLAVELIAKMLIEFATCNQFKKVVYSDVYGNHSRVFANKKADSEMTNFEYFISWGLKLKLQNYKNIIFESNVIDNTIIVKEINGVTIYEVHGNYDKFNKIASNLSMMLGKPCEIHMGHLHNNKSNEEHEVEVFLTRSFIGTNTYAKNSRLTSKAGQRLYIYENGQRKYISDIILN